MVKVETGFKNYGDFQINKIIDKSFGGEVIFYNLFDCKNNFFIGTFETETEAINKMLDVRVLASVISVI